MFSVPNYLYYFQGGVVNLHHRKDNVLNCRSARRKHTCQKRSKSLCADNAKQDYIYTKICLKSVGVRKRQVAILARSPREMSLTDRILPRYILSQVRVSVRSRIFLYAKNGPTPGSPACCLFRTALRPVHN